jgi:hypothetical protein
MSIVVRSVRSKKAHSKAVTMTEAELRSGVERMIRSCPKQITGFALIGWDSNGNGYVKVHHSMVSGVQIEELPGFAAELIDQSNQAASYEASQNPIN